LNEGATKLIKRFLNCRFDVCGVVVESKHANTPVGTCLFGRVRDGDMGTVAQYVACRPEFLAVQPTKLGDDEAAAIGLAGQTALQMIRHVGENNKSVLILGGAGGGLNFVFVEFGVVLILN
jgi:NADPH:quinone reductase-like Zn-dependent oxidoreductase